MHPLRPEPPELVPTPLVSTGACLTHCLLPAGWGPTQGVRAGGVASPYSALRAASRTGI
jgi:hypothetical protein